MSHGTGRSELQALSVQDPLLSVPALINYSSLSERSIRGFLASPHDPIPSFKVGRRILVRKSEFDSWLERRRSGQRVREIVDSILADLKP